MPLMRSSFIAHNESLHAADSLDAIISSADNEGTRAIASRLRFPLIPNAPS